MFPDRFHGFFHAHPHGAPFAAALVFFVAVLAVVALVRSNRS
jgi:hypothetical protein